MSGSWLLLILALSLVLVGAPAQGLLISTIAETQQVAFQIALLSSFLPTFILSGIHLSDLEHADGGAGRSRDVVPARYFLVALRAIVLKGAGIEAFWHGAGRARRICRRGAGPRVALRLRAGMDDEA